MPAGRSAHWLAEQSAIHPQNMSVMNTLRLLFTISNKNLIILAKYPNLTSAFILKMNTNLKSAI